MHYVSLTHVRECTNVTLEQEENNKRHFDHWPALNSSRIAVGVVQSQTEYIEKSCTHLLSAGSVGKAKQLWWSMEEGAPSEPQIIKRMRFTIGDSIALGDQCHSNASRDGSHLRLHNPPISRLEPIAWWKQRRTSPKLTSCITGSGECRVCQNHFKIENDEILESCEIQEPCHSPIPRPSKTQTLLSFFGPCKINPGRSRMKLQDKVLNLPDSSNNMDVISHARRGCGRNTVTKKSQQCCAFCERFDICSVCLHPCHECQMLFCLFCSTTDGTGRSVCLDCLGDSSTRSLSDADDDATDMQLE